MMKKTFYIIVFLLLLYSCGKMDSSIEGTWGLTHSEGYRMMNGIKTDVELVDCDPYHPATANDSKFSIFNSSGDTYVFTFSYWNPKNERWNTNPETESFTRVDQVFRYAGEGEDFYYTILSLTSDSLVIEYMNPIQNHLNENIGYLYSKGTFVRLLD